MFFDFGIAFPGMSRSSSPSTRSASQTERKSQPKMTIFGPSMAPSKPSVSSTSMARPSASVRSSGLTMRPTVSVSVRPSGLTMRPGAPSLIKPSIGMTPSKPVAVPPAVLKVSVSPTLPPPPPPRSDSEMIQQVQVMKQVDVEQAAALAAIGQQMAALKEFAENLAVAHNDTAGQVEQLGSAIKQLIGAGQNVDDNIRGLAANVASELENLSGQISNQNAAIEELVRGVAGTFTPRKTAQAPQTKVQSGFRPAVRPSITSAVPTIPREERPDLEARRAYVPEDDAEFYESEDE